MTDRTRIIVIVFMIFFIIMVLNKLHKKMMEYKFGIIWIIGAVIIELMAIFPKSLSFLAHLTGVDTPVNLLFFLGLVLAFYVIFQMGVLIAKQNNQIKNLSQEIGLLKHDLDSEKTKKENS